MGAIMESIQLERIKNFNNDRLCWGVVGEHGGIHMWIAAGLSHGGIEVHAKTPQFDGQIGSDDDCWLIGCKCYHYGSSLWWAEHGYWLLARCIEQGSDDHIWFELNRWYRSKFLPKDDE